MKFFAMLRQFSTVQKLPNLLERFVATLACMMAIFLTAWITQRLAVDSPILLASMGASAVILFVMHSSPLAQPWPLFGGHLSSGLVGIWVAHLVPEPALAAALTVSLSVLAMLILRCLHPPGAATALVPVLSYPQAREPNLEFLLMPLTINVVTLLLLTLIINRLLLRRNYPSRISLAKIADVQQPTAGNLPTVDRAEIEQAMRSFTQFIDVGSDDLQQIFTRLQLQQLQKHHGATRCGDIMQRNIVTVEYATEVESAWSLIHQRQLKVLPVLDRSRRVIGIVTQYDFMKNLQLTPHADLQHNWRAFIKRTPAITADKPEAIGHIMTRKVKTLSADAPFSELIPLLLSAGHRHVPIVDDEQRFCGLVSQANLIAALFNQQSIT